MCSLSYGADNSIGPVWFTLSISSHQDQVSGIDSVTRSASTGPFPLFSTSTVSLVGTPGFNFIGASRIVNRKSLTVRTEISSNSTPSKTIPLL